MEKAPAGLVRARVCGAGLQQGSVSWSRAPSGTRSLARIHHCADEANSHGADESRLRHGLATRKCVQGPVLKVSSRYLGFDRSAIVLSPGQTWGRETLPCSLCKIKKQETKVGRGKWGPEKKRGLHKCCCLFFFPPLFLKITRLLKWLLAYSGQQSYLFSHYNLLRYCMAIAGLNILHEQPSLFFFLLL